MSAWDNEDFAGTNHHASSQLAARLRVERSEQTHTPTGSEIPYLDRIRAAMITYDTGLAVSGASGYKPVDAWIAQHDAEVARAAKVEIIQYLRSVAGDYGDDGYGVYAAADLIEAGEDNE